MIPQKGKDFLLLVEDMSNEGSFLQIGGFRSNSFSINGETVDITSKNSRGYRELLDGAGIKSLSTSGSGIFMSDETIKFVNGVALTGIIHTWQLVVPGMGSYTAPFALTTFEMSGEHNGEVTYSLSLESAGLVAYSR
ncbi:phage major tail protein, TP901-1 family [Temperatibacter marinus]|uniref:Phage major tail protein, TP901-1 family n=1 Tax=Temperatibacter marinus TaxID=1456591 RepID=A0AA52EGS6_9PROT|nr:phage major tail protein, TP901-1 family [Temperatibacter marinus]WND02054.1 phage major tail protein, TP901-1 family [Temperatibacter marinus]